MNDGNKKNNKDTTNLKEISLESNEGDYQLKICPTDKYGDKLIEILKKEFEEEE